MHKTILIFALLAISGLAAITTQPSQYDELKDLWEAWKHFHGKEYSASTEDEARYAIFLDNYHKVNKYNSQQSDVTLRLNLFADLTAQEFKHKHSGCAFVETNEDFISANTMRFDDDQEGVMAPSSVDWRTKNVVTPVKDQGQCGSCWTFSTTGALEGLYAIAHGKLLSFSEQQIVDCASNAGQGCNGGWPYAAMQYAAANGLEQEGTYPYTAQNGQCRYNQGQAVKPNTAQRYITKNSAGALKYSISLRPTSVLVEADQQVFQFYHSGVVGANSGCGTTLDHAVLAVGYGKVDGSEAFIVKNSWGAGWGQGGYIYISAQDGVNGGAGVCGILSQPVVPY